MGLIKRINTSISVTVLAACAFAFLFFGWSATGWKALAIPTGSMRPSIPPGSLVLVHSVPLSSLKVGNVITHTNPLNPKMTISHRIIRAYKIDGIVPAFVTKGDANKIADVPIVGGQVIGKVVWHMPDAGWALIDAKKPIVILPIIYLSALLIMIEEVQRLAEYYRRFVLYKLPGYRRETEVDHKVAKRISLGGALTTAFVVIGLASSPAALAALRSNTVVLANNRLSVAKSSNGGGGTCNGNNSNNININVNTHQTAKTGNVKSSGGGNATSGNASNSNNTNINLNVSNC